MVPLFSGSQGPLCPFCGDVATYKQAADFCAREGHGMLPNRSSRGIVQLGDIVPSWVAETAPSKADFSDTAERVDRVRRRKSRPAKIKVSEGSLCYRCKKGAFEWLSGAYKCNYSGCWYVHVD